MIKLRVLEILEEQGKSKYWLYSRMGMSYQNFNRMVNNKTVSIRYDNLEKLCKHLECSLDDLFKIVPEKPEKLV